MYGLIYDYHYPENDKDKKHQQCHAVGSQGDYIIRQYGPEEWWAIALFSAIGCIMGTGQTAEDAFEKAERSLNE